MDKFLLAENPMAANAVAIVHMMEPIAIILINEGHVRVKHKGQLLSCEHYTYTNSDEVPEQWTLSLYHCFTTSFDGEETTPKVTKLFRDAWHWYMAYMTWEDTQIDEES